MPSSTALKPDGKKRLDRIFDIMQRFLDNEPEVGANAHTFFGYSNTKRSHFFFAERYNMSSEEHTKHQLFQTLHFDVSEPKRVSSQESSEFFNSGILPIHNYLAKGCPSKTRLVFLTKIKSLLWHYAGRPKNHANITRVFKLIKALNAVEKAKLWGGTGKIYDCINGIIAHLSVWVCNYLMFSLGDNIGVKIGHVSQLAMTLRVGMEIAANCIDENDSRKDSGAALLGEGHSQFFNDMDISSYLGMAETTTIATKRPGFWGLARNKDKCFIMSKPSVCKIPSAETRAHEHQFVDRSGKLTLEKVNILFRLEIVMNVLRGFVIPALNSLNDHIDQAFQNDMKASPVGIAAALQSACEFLPWHGPVVTALIKYEEAFRDYLSKNRSTIAPKDLRRIQNIIPLDNDHGSLRALINELNALGSQLTTSVGRRIVRRYMNYHDIFANVKIGSPCTQMVLCSSSLRLLWGAIVSRTTDGIVGGERIATTLFALGRDIGTDNLEASPTLAAAPTAAPRALR